MDILSLSKVIEKGVFEIMMWILFFPLTLIRMVFRPRATLAYVREEVARAALEDADEEASFEGAMRPALFLFVAVVIAAVLVPLTPEEITQFQQSELGKALLGSWISLTAYNMVVFSIVPLTGAVLLDVTTPGKVSRDSLRVPFDQQCYIGAPSMFALMGLLAASGWLGELHLVVAGLLLVLWLVYAEYVFFRDNSAMGRVRCMILALTTLFVGFLLVTVATAVTTGFGFYPEQT